MNEPKRKHKRKRNRKGMMVILAIEVVVLLAVLAVGGYVIWDRYIREPKGYEQYQFDTAAIEGRIQNMTEEEIQAELDRVIQEGMFNISIASSIVFESPQAEGQARIENIAANNYHMQVNLMLDETGETLYASKLIRPGYSIEKIKLSRALEPGEYAATAVFSAITQEEMQVIGTAGAQIRLLVLDGGATPTAQSAAAATPAP